MQNQPAERPLVRIMKAVVVECFGLRSAGRRLSACPLHAPALQRLLPHDSHTLQRVVLLCDTDDLSLSHRLMTSTFAGQWTNAGDGEHRNRNGSLEVQVDGLWMAEKKLVVMVRVRTLFVVCRETSSMSISSWRAGLGTTR